MARTKRNLEKRILLFSENLDEKQYPELIIQLRDLAIEVAKCNNEIEGADINLEESIRELSSARFTYEEMLINDEYIEEDLLMLELEIQGNSYYFDRYKDDLNILHHRYYTLTKKFQSLIKGMSL